MKSTIDIADSVLAEAKVIAAHEGTTLRSLVEEGLRRVIESRSAQPSGFKLRDVSYGSGGGAPGIDPDDWMSIKHLVRGAGG
jgi:putative antitoxin of VapBC-like toxin-antitoxin system